jgi:acetyl esterase/lipase
MASINYRLVRTALWPAQIEDCKSAIRWLKAHAREYGYDPNRIGVVGESAGGHLVAMLGTTSGTRTFDVGDNLNYTSDVACVVNLFGASDLPENRPLLLPSSDQQRKTILNWCAAPARLLSSTGMSRRYSSFTGRTINWSLTNRPND